MVTLRTVWNWANELQIVELNVALKKLRFPKSFELLPFQTRNQIEQRIQKGHLTETDVGELWEALFLVKTEIQEVLTTVKNNSTVGFLHPMLTVAAHTGARRSELLRMKVDDLEGNRLLVRERKRVRGEYSTRFVPMTEHLRKTLEIWLAKHPGGEFLFVNSRSCPITKNVAHKQLKKALKLTKWNCVKGYHVFRHSFISAMAIDGMQQAMRQSIQLVTTSKINQRLPSVRS